MWQINLNTCTCKCERNFTIVENRILQYTCTCRSGYLNINDCDDEAVFVIS